MLLLYRNTFLITLIAAQHNDSIGPAALSMDNTNPHQLRENADNSDMHDSGGDIQMVEVADGVNKDDQEAFDSESEDDQSTFDNDTVKILDADIFDNERKLSLHFRCASHTLNLVATTDTIKSIEKHLTIKEAHEKTMIGCRKL